MSIRRYLTLILIASITLTVFLATINSYKLSVVKAQVIFDVQLQSLANIVGGLPIEKVSQKQMQTTYFAMQLWQKNTLMMQTSTAPSSAIAPFKEAFSYQNFNGQRWRVWSEPVADNRWLMVAQPIALRTNLTQQVILAAVTPIIMSIVFLAIITPLVLRRSLQPLTKLAALIKHKKVNDLSPISLTQAPAELVPVVERLNHLLGRLNEAFLREKHFASDAAHELRTPLSILKVNLYNLTQEQPESTPLNHLALGLDRMSNIVDQILMLNRTNPEQFVAKFTAIDLMTLTQRVISQLYPQIIEKQQTISLESPDDMGSPHYMIDADELSIEILLQNLITNAIKYTPSNGIILVSLSMVHSSDKHTLTLLVEDSGPGIEKALRQRVFDRFYRVGGDQHQSQVIGCGLELAISSHIATLHGTQIALDDSVILGGLSARINFKQPTDRVLGVPNV